LFVFFGKRRDAAKILFFDGSGLCLFVGREWPWSWGLCSRSVI
jgi:hypothetical protein